jgi:amino acid adenylation domain-containing protein
MSELSYAAQGIWVTELAGVAGDAYHLGLVIRFDGRVDEAALRRACAAVLARHPLLGLAVADPDGVPRFAPAPAAPGVVDADLTEPLVDAELGRPYDLRRGPLARFVLAAGAGGGRLLVFAAHHLVFDGMSKEIVVRDLAAAYNSAVAGRVLTAPAPLALDGSDRSRVEAQLDAARQFWGTRWRQPDEVLLPGLTRTPVAAEASAALEVTLGGPRAAALASTARALGVTRFELLLGAVHALLRRYGNADAAVAVDLSTRTAATRDHVGLFVNELPVAVPPAGDSFRELVQALRTELRAVYQFRAVPLSRAVGGLRPRVAMTPVSVSYRRGSEQPAFAGVGAAVDWMAGSPAVGNAMHVQILDSPAGLALRLRYSPSAIDPDAVARIAAHLRTLLDGGLAAPDTPVAGLPLLPEDELDRVLRRGNATDRAYPPGATLPALLAARARQSPERVAVAGPAGRLTYRELQAAVGRLAGRLRGCGAGPGALVGVCLPRSPELLVALLAIGWAGAAYVPVDRAHPPDRRRLILADAAPALVVTTEALALDLPPDQKLLLLDGAAADPAPSTGAAESVTEARPGDLAYVMYTSGSTGLPKGVAVSHRALANLLLAQCDALPTGPGDVWLGLTSVAFDISIVELFLPLVVGGKVVIAPDSALRDGTALVRLIREHGVNRVQATPSGWQLLLAGGFGAPAAEPARSAAEPVVALAGGEALPPALARELLARVSRLFNMYGPTETTVWSTADELAGHADEVSIGRPIANTRAYVLDPGGQPLPLGVPGELYLAGAGLAEGYLGRPELTAQRFLPDPFAPPGSPGRLYRTGDRVRWRPDGRLDFLGRLDDQVKVRGHRVEPGEIEAWLLDHPAVAQAAVVARPEHDDLAAYLVARGAAPSPGQLREHLGRILPAAMVPGVFVFLDRLPLTPSGKLDRAALPEPAAPRAESGTTAARPEAAEGTSAVAQVIREIWQDVLRISDIGLDDDLFDLGGHSLTITRIIARMQDKLGVSLPLDAFFDTPTIAGIAEAAQRMSAAR